MITQSFDSRVNKSAYGSSDEEKHISPPENAKHQRSQKKSVPVSGNKRFEYHIQPGLETVDLMLPQLFKLEASIDKKNRNEAMSQLKQFKLNSEQNKAYLSPEQKEE